jgi:hypothetical protein
MLSPLRGARDSLDDDAPVVLRSLAMRNLSTVSRVNSPYG